jgi:hypothetical protein
MIRLWRRQNEKRPKKNLSSVSALSCIVFHVKLISLLLSRQPLHFWTLFYTFIIAFLFFQIVAFLRYLTHLSNHFKILRFRLQLLVETPVDDIVDDLLS